MVKLKFEAHEQNDCLDCPKPVVPKSPHVCLDCGAVGRNCPQSSWCQACMDKLNAEINKNMDFEAEEV